MAKIMPNKNRQKCFKLFHIKSLQGVDSLSVFHAAAHLGIECVIITSPASTFLSTGYFDNAKEILNRKMLNSKKLPVFRRKIGGGLVLLDKDQVFYQVILKRNNPLLPRVVKNAYRKFSHAPIESFRQLGVAVEYRPINDLLVSSSQAKISGQGAGVIEDSFVFAGNILLDFNYKLMTDVVKIPEDRRELLLDSLQKGVTSLKRELGVKPEKDEVESVLIKNFLKSYPELHEATIPAELFELSRSLSETMISDDYVYEETGREHNKIKIREGVFFDLKK